MDAESAPLADRLIADLNKLRRDAGSPSLSELVRLSQRKLSRSTLHDHLAGNRTQIPPWRLVSAYVSACHAAAAKTGLDVMRLGTISEWHAKWAAAASAHTYQQAVEGRGEDNQEATEEASGESNVLAETRDYFVMQPASTDTNQATPKIPAIFDKQSDTLTREFIAPVILRLEEDFSKLTETLPPYTGLLVVTSGPTVGSAFTIEHNITTIGRDPESDIWLNDRAISRQHATINRRGGSFFLSDSNSHNGTFLRNRLVETEVMLSVYDELRIAGFTLMFLQTGEKSKINKKGYRPIRSRLTEDASASTARFQAFAQRPDSDYFPYSRRGFWGRRRKRD